MYSTPIASGAGLLEYRYSTNWISQFAWRSCRSTMSQFNISRGSVFSQSHQPSARIHALALGHLYSSWVPLHRSSRSWRANNETAGHSQLTTDDCHCHCQPNSDHSVIADDNAACSRGGRGAVVQRSGQTASSGDRWERRQQQRFDSRRQHSAGT